MTERTPGPEPVTTDWGDDDDPNQDTIALLQEEVARLEGELRARDELPAPAPDLAHDSDALDELRRRADGLLAELAERDEMVAILLEQSRLFEEAAAAQRAEWEQLNAWVAEVERRVEGNDTDAPRLLAELEAERRQAEQLRLSAESDRREWEAQRAGLRHESQLLRDQLARQPQGQDARDDAAFIELAAENRQLRTDIETLREAGRETAEIGRRLAATLVELEQARREFRHLDDDLRRERIEHEAELGAVRSRLASESLARQVDPAAPSQPTAPPAPTARPSSTEADERIRAFRQHLRELHEVEAAQRADRSISSRLSRIWRKTGPA